MVGIIFPTLRMLAISSYQRANMLVGWKNFTNSRAYGVYLCD